MAGAGLEAAFRLHAFQHTQEFGHIFLVARWNDVQIECIDWGTVQYCRQPANDSELYAAFAQRAQSREKVAIRH